MATFAILVGGGPAPGLNGVISAVGLEALSREHRILGISTGYERLMKGDKTCARELGYDELAWIHRLGGSVIGTSRANPTKSQEHLQNVVSTLKDLGVDYLVTTGGDDTATSAQAVAKAANGSLKVGHVPKTIDNDLPLPPEVPTFGFQTAREVGAAVVHSLLADAFTAGRWYIAIAMGRKAGHLALGMGFSAGAPLTLIPEQFPKTKFSMSVFVDLITGSILKSRALGRNYGVAVLAEGLLELVDPASIPEIESAERDEHGHIRYAELDFGGIMKRAVTARLQEIGGPKVTIVEKNIGYELRSCDPNAFDREYTRLLGYGIVDYLLSGGSEAMISLQGGELKPVPFAAMIDPQTKKTAVRYVDVNSAAYLGAQSYMTRLKRSDLENQETLAKLSKLTKLSPEEFSRQFNGAL